MPLPPKKTPDPIIDGFIHIKNEKLRACLCALREMRLMVTWAAIAAAGLFGAELSNWLKTML
ncbi:hypothetical protein LJR129_005139 [Acidovorax sp. LjRoot129]|uniref:hypothetical protein n=1 Tax=Acidovorax sp. LjRoot129 TaxID=3342260 RepID=UPI003ED0E8B8